MGKSSFEERSERTQGSFNSEQAFAKKVVEINGRNINTLLIKRSKALLAFCMATLVVLVFEAFHIVPPILSKNFTTGTTLTAVNSIVQLSVLFYFSRTKDPDITALLIKLLLVVSCFGLLFGFFGGVPFFIISCFILLQISALGAMSRYKIRS